MHETPCWREPDATVEHWAFDPVAGLITAHNQAGQLLMAVPARAEFPARLVQAFNAPRAWPTAARPDLRR